jgi:hypothetical protein
MTTLKIDNFAGIAPRMSNRLLPYNGAVTAANAKLLSGELRGLRETQLLHDFGNPLISRGYRLPEVVGEPIPLNYAADLWIGFVDSNVDFVRTPVLEDSFERYYWTGDGTQNNGVPMYSTRAILAADGTTAPWALGIPAPVTAPTVTPASGTDSVRAYVYTFVSTYGEEGAPSPATIAEGTAGTWTISGMDTTLLNPINGDTALSTIAYTRIYRTVAGSGTTTTYFHVADIAFGVGTYSDTALDEIVALNYTMQSLTWDPPPTDLEGLCVHPGGFLMGFTGRSLYLSQPYQPHAWPVENILTTQTEIVGLAVYFGLVIVLTTSNPYYGEGMTPSGITLQKIDSIDPCVNRRSIAATLNGAYYASPQGIIVATAGATSLATQQLFTREEWQNDFSPTTVQAVSYGLQYVAFDTAASGFIFSPAETLAPLTTLDRFSFVTAIQTDVYSGDVYLMQKGQARLWDPPESTPYEYTWLSKEFDLPRPVNFGALKLKFQGGGYHVAPSLLQDYILYNEQRIAFPLNCVNCAPINGVRTWNVPITGQPAILPQIKCPIGGSELYNVAILENITGAVQVTIYARTPGTQTWNTIATISALEELTYRLPAGFKSDGWQIEFIGNVPIYSFAMAETGKELQQI